MINAFLKKDESCLDDIKNIKPQKSQYDGYDLFEIPSSSNFV